MFAFPGWYLIAEKKTCRGSSTYKGHVENIAECALQCKEETLLRGRMFVYGTNDFNKECPNARNYKCGCKSDGTCRCYCVISEKAYGSCDLDDAKNLNLYKYSNPGKGN